MAQWIQHSKTQQCLLFLKVPPSPDPTSAILAQIFCRWHSQKQAAGRLLHDQPLLPLQVTSNMACATDWLHDFIDASELLTTFEEDERNHHDDLRTLVDVDSEPVSPVGCLTKAAHA